MCVCSVAGQPLHKMAMLYCIMCLTGSEDGLTVSVCRVIDIVEDCSIILIKLRVAPTHKEMGKGLDPSIMLFSKYDFHAYTNKCPLGVRTRGGREGQEGGAGGRGRREGEEGGAGGRGRREGVHI